MSEVGARMLGIHIVLSIIGFLIATNDKCGSDIQAIISAITSVTLIILWYIAIRSVRKKGFSKSIKVSLLFTVPSVLLGLAYFSKPDPCIDSIFLYYGMIYNYPLYLGTFFELSSPYAFFSIPVIVMNLLLLINFIEYALETKIIQSKLN